MKVVDDAGEDDHPELPPPHEVWLAERRVYAAAAHLRALEQSVSAPDAMRGALLDDRAARLRVMVSLCNVPLAERPEVVERGMETLRVVHLMRGTSERGVPSKSDALPRVHDAPPEPSHG